MTEYEVERLLSFAVSQKFLHPLDVIPARNALLDLLKLKKPYEGSVQFEDDSASEVLKNLLDYAVSVGLTPEDTITNRDLFEARIMGLITPAQSAAAKKFYDDYAISPCLATDGFYKMSQDCRYIQMDRIRKNIYWRSETDYGELEITINLSKPEKDPKEIAAAKSAPQSDYPLCLLCAENAGFAGDLNRPARQNHRIIPVTLNGSAWYFQYSPYVYYNEHCIILNEKHIPMKISKDAFSNLLSFTEIFPHYFLGSNADLPVVGGSILTHDHYQGGRHVFPMELAPIKSFYEHKSFPGVSAGIVKWPMSVIRLSSADKQALIDLAGHILSLWRNYSDSRADIEAFSGQTPHNTITPIARNKNGIFELDLVLRNNRATDEHPLGLFHPHAELHHIKKENIGLIEVMGLAILPGRLLEELSGIERLLSSGRPINEQELQDPGHPLNIHMHWILKLAGVYGSGLSEEEARSIVRYETAKVFEAVLSDAGVFKDSDEGLGHFNLFMERAGLQISHKI